jgi:hypothetical protein
MDKQFKQDYKDFVTIITNIKDQYLQQMVKIVQTKNCVIELHNFYERQQELFNLKKYTNVLTHPSNPFDEEDITKEILLETTPVELIKEFFNNNDFDISTSLEQDIIELYTLILNSTKKDIIKHRKLEEKENELNNKWN